MGSILALAMAPKTRGNPLNELSCSRIVVLVEDSDDDAFFFERAFDAAKTGAQLIRLADGRAAVEYLERNIESADSSERHLVFLDLKLPVWSGFDVLRWMRERGLAVEVVVLSGSDLEPDIDLARRLGASDYLVKPISSMEIGRRVAGVCKQV